MGKPVSRAARNSHPDSRGLGFAPGTTQNDNSPGAKVFFSNSGTEANEAALKIARKVRNDRWASAAVGRAWDSLDCQKTQIVCFEGSIHGRNMNALSVTSSPSSFCTSTGPSPPPPCTRGLLQADPEPSRLSPCPLTSSTASIPSLPHYLHHPVSTQATAAATAHPHPSALAPPLPLSMRLVAARHSPSSHRGMTARRRPRPPAQAPCTFSPSRRRTPVARPTTGP